mmetsp:Transcript_10345/g.16884  ORF Transcript_10345/g.16884 Transcript_10345/m.16884 type:complete len:259 (+) Transcript_10345:344-1120(+)
MAMAPKLALVTLITSDDFLPGVQVVVASFCRHSKIREQVSVVVLALGSLAKTTLLRLRKLDGVDTVKVIEGIHNPMGKDSHVRSWAETGFTKLQIWNFGHEFERVVYIDADCLIVDNIDELFTLDIGQVGFAAAPDVFPPDKFNAGVLVIRPSVGLFKRMVEQIPVLGTYDGGDTGFLNAFFPTWYSLGANNRLPFRYNAQRLVHAMTYANNPGYWDAIRPCIVHFSSSPKPWEVASNPNCRLGSLASEWWDCFLNNG